MCFPQFSFVFLRNLLVGRAGRDRWAGGGGGGSGEGDWFLYCTVYPRYIRILRFSAFGSQVLFGVAVYGSRHWGGRGGTVANGHGVPQGFSVARSYEHGFVEV